MPAKKTDSRTNKTKGTQESKTSVFDYLRFGESYTSLVLGIIVVIISTILLLSFIQNRNANKNRNTQVVTAVSPTPIAGASATVTVIATSTVTKIPSITPTPITSTVAPTKAQLQPTQKPQEKKKTVSSKDTVYVVTANDSLWSISEKVYKSGYKWVDIARANKLNNPGVLHKGDRLVLPSIEQKTTTVATPPAEKVVANTDRITGTVYTVVKNDTLWDISVRSYGDGYKWVDIARANNLQNPSIIHSGNKLKIPRSQK